MKRFLIILGLIFVLIGILAFKEAVAQTTTVPLVFQTPAKPNGCDSLFIWVQTATDSLFNNIVQNIPKSFVQPSSQFTYNAQFSTSILDQRYWWRGKMFTEDGLESAWSVPWWFRLVINQAPTVPTLVSPVNGAIIQR